MVPEKLCDRPETVMLCQIHLEKSKAIPQKLVKPLFIVKCFKAQGSNGSLDTVKHVCCLFYQQRLQILPTTTAEDLEEQCSWNTHDCLGAMNRRWERA